VNYYYHVVNYNLYVMMGLGETGLRMIHMVRHRSHYFLYFEKFQTAEYTFDT
jgi:hypothetical protein